MSLPLPAFLKSTIAHHEMLHPGDRVALAVSGGADSVALLRLFEELRESLGMTLCVAHFNHQLRGKNSDADEAFVESLARRRGFEFIVERDDVSAAAKRHDWNLEDAARRLRYDFFERLVSEGRATRVATAHTADDQAETVLLRLIRGTGLTGLSAIHPVRGCIIRPLLEMRRKDLRSYLKRIKQEWREDASNADTRRLRARVREHLLPRMETEFSPAIVGNLSGLAALAREDEKFWNFLVQERCESLVTRAAGESSVQIHDLLWPLGDAHCGDAAESAVGNPFHALTQRIVRLLFANTSKERGELSRKHVEEVIRLAETGASGREIQLPGRVRARKEFDRLAFRAANPAPSERRKGASVASYSYKLDLPRQGSVTITVAELGKRFSLKVIDWPVRERETRHEGVILDVERLRSPLVLRNWGPGDAYRPRGHRGKRKLSRILTAHRIASAKRPLWPVLTSAGRIAWAYRMPPAEEFSTNEATRTGLWIVEDAG